LAENTDNVKLQLEHLKEAEKYNPDPHTKGQISLARGLLYCNELDRKEDAVCQLLPPTQPHHTTSLTKLIY